MVDFVGLMSGFNERERENVASRKDMAKAFADYKAANPYASAAEFQEFIDSYSGGRNYIAGGAPGSEIIAALGQENTEKQARDILRQQVADASARSALIDDITGRAENYLVGLEPEKEGKPIDFGKAASDFYETLGIDEAAAKSFFGDQPLTSIFNEPNRKRLQLAAIEDKLPRFLEYIKGNGGYGSEQSFKDAVALFDIPKFMVEPMRLRVKQELKDANIELMDSRRERMLTRAKEGIAEGNVNIRQLLEGDAENFGLDIKSEDSKAYFASVESQAKREYQEAQLALQDEKFESLMKFAERQIALGNASTLSKTLATKAQGKGLDINDSTFTAFAEEIIAEAQRVRNQANEDRRRAQNTENAAATNAFRSTLKNDADLNALIRRGMLTEAQAEIDNMVARYSDQNVKALMKDVGDQFIQSRTALLQDAQDDILRERYDAAKVANIEVGSNFKTANVEAATNHFTAFAGSGQTNPNAGVHSGNAAMAAQDLALEFQMTPSTLAIITDVFNSIKEPASRQQLAQAARQQLQGIAQPFSQAQSAAVNNAMLKADGGSYAQDTTVDNWRQTTTKGIEDHTSGITNGIEAIRQSDRSLEDKMRMLEALNQQMQQGFVYINSAIQDSIKESTGKETWVTYGTPMLDAEAEYYGPNGLRPKIQNTIKTLTAIITQESEKYAEEIAAATAAPPPASNSSITSNAPTVAGRQTDIDRQTNARRDTVDQFRDVAYNKIDLIGRTFSNQTDAQYQDNLALAAFLSNAHGNMKDSVTVPFFSGSFAGYDDTGPAGVMDDIIGDDDAFRRFKLNPVKFMKSYELPNGTNWYEGWLERNQ